MEGKTCKRIKDRTGMGIERISNSRIARRVYERECAGSRLLGRPRKRWIDSVNDCLKKRGLNIRQAKNMVYDRNEWRGFVRGMFGS